MGKTLILKPLLRSLNSISFMIIIFTYQLIQTIRIIWFCHRSESTPHIILCKHVLKTHVTFMLNIHIGTKTFDQFTIRWQFSCSSLQHLVFVLGTILMIHGGILQTILLSHTPLSLSLHPFVNFQHCIAAHQHQIMFLNSKTTSLHEIMYWFVRFFKPFQGDLAMHPPPPKDNPKAPRKSNGCSLACLYDVQWVESHPFVFKALRQNHRASRACHTMMYV
jgi:hypothetical protein